MTTAIKAKEILEKGGIVIFPTETVFGIGCLLKFTKTIKKLYQVKRRDTEKGTLCLFASIEKVRQLVKTDERFEILAKNFWPGPLTIVAPVRKTLPRLVLGPRKSLGTRVPDHPFLKRLLPTLSSPLLSPSANFQEARPPRTVSEIDKQLIELVDYVVNIEPGGLQPSTIVNLTTEPYNIIRSGSLNESDIKKVLES